MNLDNTRSLAHLPLPINDAPRLADEGGGAVNLTARNIAMAIEPVAIRPNATGVGYTEALIALGADVDFPRSFEAAQPDSAATFKDLFCNAGSPLVVTHEGVYRRDDSRWEWDASAAIAGFALAEAGAAVCAATVLLKIACVARMPQNIECLDAFIQVVRHKAPDFPLASAECTHLMEQVRNMPAMLESRFSRSEMLDFLGRRLT